MKLKRNDNTYTNNQFEILHEQKVFYETLNTSKNIENENFSNSPFFNLENIIPLSEDEKLSCEGALKEFENDKTPGTDGLSAEFYKFFFGQRCVLK